MWYLTQKLYTTWMPLCSCDPIDFQYQICDFERNVSCSLCFRIIYWILLFPGEYLFRGCILESRSWGRISRTAHGISGKPLCPLWWRHSSSRLYLQKESRPTPSFPKFDTPWRDIFNAVWSIETTIVLEVSNISIKVSWKDLGGKKKVSFSFGQGIEKKESGKERNRHWQSCWQSLFFDVILRRKTNKRRWTSLFFKREEK